MIEAIVTFFTYVIPWWVWIAVAAVGVLLIWRALGFEWAVAFLAACAVAIAHRRGEQRGWQKRGEQGERNVQRNVDKAKRAGAAADRRDADPARLRDDDGWRRD
jgi:hypothetical protein